MISLRLLAGSAAIALVLTSCGGSGDEDSIATADSAAPATLPQLDGVVVTVSPEDLIGERIVLEDLDGDGEMEITTGTVAAEVDVAEAEAEAEAVADATASSDMEAPAPEASDDDGLNPFGGDDPEDKRMPDVVCMGLQAAQDEIQDRGVLLSKSEDATGAGRRQIWDRNWIVVSQTPAPGEPIGERDAVLSVVKTDEDNPC